MGAAEVPVDRQPRPGELANGLKNVPTQLTPLKSPRVDVRPNYKTFLDVAGNKNTATTPATAAGAHQELFKKFCKWQAREGRRPGRGAEIDKRSTRSSPSVSTKVPDVSARRPRRPARARLPVRFRHRRPAAALAPAPAGAGLLALAARDLLRVPALAIVYFSFTRYNLLSIPRWSACQLRVHAPPGPADLAGGANTLWFVSSRCRCRSLFAFGVAGLLTARKRRRVLPHAVLPARRWRRRWRPRSASSTSSTRPPGR